MNKAYTFPSMSSDRQTLIMGLGETGVAAARWCEDRGVPIRLADTRDRPPRLNDLSPALIAGAARFGPRAFDGEALEGVDRIILSPGLNPREAPASALLALARTRGIEVMSEMELFARALADLRTQGYAPAVFGVTGTNGKTTVTALTRHLMRASGRSARAAGNIGPAGLASLRDALAAGDLPRVWVLELSSFQLMATESLVLDAAVVLNVSQDHLDWHGSLQSYADAKARIFGMAKRAVINRDDAWVRGMARRGGGAEWVSFGSERPECAGDFGLVTKNGLDWLAVSSAADAGAVALMPARDLRIRGRHNAMNALAALALARTVTTDWEPLLRGLRDYPGEPHRTELIRRIRGVDFIDDSKGTNVGATLAALEGLDQPLVLIAGGLGKGQDFSPLIPALKARVRAVMLIGEAAPLLARIWADCGVPLIRCGGLDQAVRNAFERAARGEAVLLSPACASMDMFRNYIHRSECFVAAVNALAAEEEAP